ncbi:MAG: GNAT family N-acetyltransferase [Clostridia bacterium]|nr:GNAT family N-acetyltransferase [Clostridia bacterium]
MVTIYWASPEEKYEIIDFLDYIFSKEKVPHDFATLQPKLYGPNGDGAQHHVVMRDGHRIIATLACYPIKLNIKGKIYTLLGVGSVCTRPSYRGRGYMRMLMSYVDQRAKELGATAAVLTGQRQRYQYYGFDCGGYQLRARLEEMNVRHALRDVSTDGMMIVPMAQEHVSAAMELMKRQPCYGERTEENFIDVLRTWYSQPMTVLKDGKVTGYVTVRPDPKGPVVGELLLDDEADYPAVLKMLFASIGPMWLNAAPWERQRVRWLSSVCEDYCVAPIGMLKIYNQAHVDEASNMLDGFLSIAPALYISTLDAV